MTVEMHEKLDKLLKSYSAYFDIRKDTVSGGQHFAAEADFHSRSEKYMLMKSAKIWAAETNEFVFIPVCEEVNADGFNKFKTAVVETGLARIIPHNEHMYTYVTLLILADKIDSDTAKAIKHANFRKNFRFTLYGWMELRVIAMELSTGALHFNTSGRALKKLLCSI